MHDTPTGPDNKSDLSIFIHKQKQVSEKKHCYLALPQDLTITVEVTFREEKNPKGTN